MASQVPVQLLQVLDLSALEGGLQNRFEKTALVNGACFSRHFGSSLRCVVREIHIFLSSRLFLFVRKKDLRKESDSRPLWRDLGPSALHVKEG